MTRRVLVVGWDGATWDAIDPLLAEGALPHLERLLAGGFRGRLRSTVPPVTPAAWTAIATGMGPGRTGVLGFRHLDLRRASGFDPRLAGSDDLRGRTLFEHAASVGVALAAYPMTWPPLPVPDGVVLSGWPRPETEAPPVWPPEEARRLARALGPWGTEGPSSTRFTRDGRDDPEAAAEQLDARTMAVALRWLREREDRLAFVGLQGSDHLAHRFWGQPALRRCYERFDRWLGELLDAAGPDTACVVVSDHGFGPGPSFRVHLGRALGAAGLLSWAPSARASGRAARAVRRGLPTRAWKRLRAQLPHSVRRWGFEQSLASDGLDPRRTAVARVGLYEGWEGLVVQVQGRQRQGRVPPGQWEQVRTRAREVVEAIEHDGAPVVRRVWAREEVWDGPAVAHLPDLVVELAEGFTAGDQLDPGPVVEPLDRGEHVGSHRRHGIVAGGGPGFADAGAVGEIDPWDVLPTALALLDVGVPSAIDGRPIPALLTRAAPPPVPRRASRATPSPAAPPADLERSLRELGYL